MTTMGLEQYQLEQRVAFDAGWLAAMMDLAEPARDRHGVVHARALSFDGKGTRLCVLPKSYLHEVHDIRMRAWRTPVTCLWCFVRLVRQRRNAGAAQAPSHILGKPWVRPR